MLVDLLDQEWTSKSSDQNQAQLINMYLEPDAAKGKYKVVAFPIHGLTLFSTTGGAVLRDMYELNGVTYCVSGNLLQSVNSSGTATTLGTLNTSTGFAKIRAITGASDENHQLFIIDGTNGYSYNIFTNTFITITNTTFVSSINVTNNGTNYSNPTVTISDATGTGATATATVSSGAGQISSIQIINEGSGYTTPTITINDTNGTGAVASATVTGGLITSITVINTGSGYVAPSVSITGTGSGASAVALIAGGEITAVTVTNAGSNYTAPTVAFTDITGIGAAGSVQTVINSFPNTATDIENQDDYILAVENDSMQYQISNVSDSTTWNPLNFASKFGQPDNINAILSHEAMIWFFGNKTTEVWQDAGETNSLNPFPFVRVNTTFLHYGCPAKQSIAVNGNYFIFLSSNGKGGYSVFQTLPRIYYYNPAPVSTPIIDTLISTFSVVSDAIGTIYNLDGHEFYTLTFPTAGYTLVYDIPKAQQADAQKGAWYIRQSGTTQGRFLGNCGCFCYGKNLVGDYSSGNIYYQDNTNYTENGAPILREFVSPAGPMYQGGKRVFVSRLQIDVETGVGSNETFTLEKSLDNGATWLLVRTFTVPAKGGRLYATGLGSTRYGMIFRIKTTMNAKFCLLGFQAEVQVGHS